MEDNVQVPLDNNDLTAVASALRRAAKLAPDPSWNEGATGWATIANEAAAAAAGGDLSATQKACKSCHKAWRSKYKATFRQRAIR